MSNTQHTPGPWAVATRVDAAAIVDANENRLACLSYGRGSVSMKIESEQNNANARLIAAAPELLEQLKMLVRWAEDQGQTCTFARAAITKATGEAP